MALLTLLKNWKEAAIGFLGVAFMLLFTWFKYRGNKIDKLEHEIKMHDKQKEMTKEQDVFVAKSLADEQDKILEVMNDDKKSRHDDVNSL